MPVHVPFRLMRHERRDTCAALLLLSTDARDVLDLCGRVRIDPLPAIFPVAGGFLVIPEEMPGLLPARTIRLRRLSENCFVPVDADLVPAIHPAETADLTRQRGLVFLPDGQCLAFDPERALELSSLFKILTPKREAWKPFPDGQMPADRLTTITRVVPDLAPESILDAGGEDIGVEEPRPPASNPIKTAAGKMALGLGKGLIGMGVVLGVGALAKLGQKLIARAVKAVPRLSESLLGKQEAALRELLRKFREGRIDEGLRKALPMDGTNQPGTLHTSDELPTHDIRYSLSGLSGGGGPASLWVGGQEIQRELMNEYRKAAQAALAQGDHRRAAFIYGKLLGEMHTAADVLAKGGLHRDAAIIFRDLLHEPRFAAREFEAAGECDEALRLYRLIHDHETAGDLLRRMGEEGQAIEEYHEAARMIVTDRHDYLAAGDLMLRKTGRPDLAGAYFALGWRERDHPLGGGNANLCGVRLAELLAFVDPLEPFWQHIDEVEKWLASRDATSTATFFNKIVSLAELPHLSKHRVELRDRAKLALAAKLRDHSLYETRPGNTVSNLFGNSGLWPAAVVSDANFALRTLLKSADKPKSDERPFNTIRVGNGKVTAVAFAPEAEEIVVGFANGEVVIYHPPSGRVARIAAPSPEGIEAIAIDPFAKRVVVADGHDPELGMVRLRSFRRDNSGKNSYETERKYPFATGDKYYLNPIIDEHDNTLLSTPAGTTVFGCRSLVLREPDSSEAPASPTYLVLTAPKRRTAHTEMDVSATKAIIESGASFPSEGRSDSRIAFKERYVDWSGTANWVGWRPHVPEESPLVQPPIAWLQTSAESLELAGISEEGAISWSLVKPRDGNMTPAARTHSIARPEGFRAVTIWKPGMVIGVTSNNQICWLRVGNIGLKEWAPTTSIPIPTKPVACFPCPSTGEVVVILADGETVRIPVPV